MSHSEKMSNDCQIELNTDNLLKYIADKGSVTFVGIQRVFSDSTGGMGLLKPGNNIVLWCGMSKKLTDVITSLIKDKSIQLNTVSPLIYLIDGGVLTMPLALGDNYEYQEEHWLPVVFDVRD